MDILGQRNANTTLPAPLQQSSNSNNNAFVSSSLTPVSVTRGGAPGAAWLLEGTKPLATSTCGVELRDCAAVLRSNKHNGKAAAVGSGRGVKWTKTHSPWKVLGAQGIIQDFYSQGLSWGDEAMAVLLSHQLLLFDPHSASGGYSSFTSPASAGAFSAVAMCPASNTSCVVADVQGSCCVASVQQGTSDMVISNVISHGSSIDGLPLPSELSLRRIAAISMTPAEPSIVAVGNGFGMLRLYDLRQPTSQAAMHFGAATEGGRAHRNLDEVTVASFNSTGALLASGSNGNDVQVWALTNPSVPAASFRSHTAAVRALAWDPQNSGRFVSGGGSLDGSLLVCDSRREEVCATVFTSSQVLQAAFNSEGTHLVTTHGFSRWDLLVGDGTPFSPRAPSVTCEVPLKKNNVCVWSMPSGCNGSDRGGSDADPPALLSELVSHTDRPLFLARQENGTGHFATAAGGTDETIRFWSLFTAASPTSGAVGQFQALR